MQVLLLHLKVSMWNMPGDTIRHMHFPIWDRLKAFRDLVSAAVGIGQQLYGIHRESVFWQDIISYKEADEVEEAINSSWFPGTGFVTLHRGDGTLHDDEGPEEYFVDVRETRKELAKSEKYIRLCRKHIKVKTTSKMSDKEKVAAITEALCHYMQYKESGRSLQYRIRKGRGVCADYSTFFKALCWANGLECRMIGGKADTGSGIWEDHAWNRVRISGKWYYIDTTWIDSTAGAGDKITSNPYYLSRKLWRDHLTR